MTEEMDAGDILLQRETPIAPDDTGGTLGERLARLGAQAIGEAIGGLQATLRPVPQPAAGVTFAPRIEREHPRLDSRRPAVQPARGPGRGGGTGGEGTARGEGPPPCRGRKGRRGKPGPSACAAPLTRRLQPRAPTPESLPRRLCRPRHAVRTIHRTPHARFPIPTRDRVSGRSPNAGGRARRRAPGARARGA